MQAIIYLTALMKRMTLNTNKGYQNGHEVKRLKQKQEMATLSNFDRNRIAARGLRVR